MTLCVVRCPYTLTGNVHELRVQFAVGIFVVEHRYAVSARRDPGEFADCRFLSNRRANVRKSFLALFREAFAR